MAEVYIAPGNAYHLVIPDGWEFSVCRSSVAFYDPNGVGALNVSCLRPPKGIRPDTSSIALNFVPKELLESGKLSIESRGCHGEDGWRLCVFATHDRAVMFSYNCRLSSEGKEAAMIDEIIASVRLECAV
jgi:hypothetical protein